MLKNIILSLLLVNCTYGFTSNMQKMACYNVYLVNRLPG